MSRIPSTPTGLAFLTDNPFAPPAGAESPALSIARAAETAPMEQQDALARALFGTTGMLPEPASEKQRDEIRALELADRVKVARAASDSRNPITQEALNAIVQQHNQKWSVYGFLSSMPSPAAIYSQKAAEDDPAVRNEIIGRGLKEYEKTGEYNDDLTKVLLSENSQDRDFVNARLDGIDKKKKDAATALTDRNKAISETMVKMFEHKDDPVALRTLYQSLRVRYSDLPAVTNENATLEDFRFAMAGRELGLSPPQPEPPGLFRRLVFGEEAAPAANFNQRVPEPPLDTRRMTNAEKQALWEEVNRTGKRRAVIRKDGSVAYLNPKAK